MDVLPGWKQPKISKRYDVREDLFGEPNVRELEPHPQGPEEYRQLAIGRLTVIASGSRVAPVTLSPCSWRSSVQPIVGYQNEARETRPERSRCRRS